MTDKVQYWIDMSEYDLDTATAMLETNDTYMLVLCVIRLSKKD